MVIILPPNPWVWAQIWGLATKNREKTQFLAQFYGFSSGFLWVLWVLCKQTVDNVKVWTICHHFNSQTMCLGLTCGSRDLELKNSWETLKCLKFFLEGAPLPPKYIFWPKFVFFPLVQCLNFPKKWFWYKNSKNTFSSFFWCGKFWVTIFGAP